MITLEKSCMSLYDMRSTPAGKVGKSESTVSELDVSKPK